MEYLCDTLREPTITSLIPQVSCSFRFCLSLSLSLVGGIYWRMKKNSEVIFLESEKYWSEKRTYKIRDMF